jgi:manganese oxidase
MLKFTKVQTILMLVAASLALLFVAVWAPDIQAAMLGNAAPATLAQTGSSAQDADAPAQLTQSAEAGAVTVVVTPLNLLDAQDTLDFTIVLDTHSVELDMDLSEMAVLQIGETEIAATAWDAPAGGHHVEGVLSFPALDDAEGNILAEATSVTLVLRGLAGVSERTFTWDREDLVGASAAMPEQDTSAMPGMGMSGMMGQNMIGSSIPMTGTMPMGGDMAQMMGMMGNMMAMMSQMDDMSMEDHQAMMGQMMAMMQGMMGMMGQMEDMPMEEHQAMMAQMMAMMQGMMSQMDDMPHDAIGEMDDHMAPIPSAGVPDATETVGGQPLAYEEEDGVKVFELTAQPVRWTILESDEEQVAVTAWTYNGTVPGPLIRVTEGDEVRIVLTNDLPVPTSIHWHGIPLPNEMDGVPPFTQDAIQPGESFVYEFTAPPAGSFMYHSHVDTDVQIMVGLYAPFIVDPQEPEADAPDVDVMWMLSEWRVGADGETYAAMPMAGAEPNYFTINGKAFPNTERIVVNVGDRVRIRLAGIGQFVHPMHLHGMNFQVVAYDGVSLPPEQQIVRNTIPINPGEVVDIEFVADNPGTWIFHCHVLHHVTNDNEEPGGIIGVIEVVEE